VKSGSNQGKNDGFARRWLWTVAVALVAVASSAAAHAENRVLVLGVDGLDPKLLTQFTEEGVLPNFERLMEQGDFKPLQTTMPPLSPVAWSTFITGMDPGGHGLFDFIHRDPKRYLPTPAMSQAPELTLPLKLGSCEYPLPWAGADPVNLRRGTAFWELLAGRDIPTTLFRIPADFPATQVGRTLSGMGAPDLVGTHGTFSFYTDRVLPNAGDISGGNVYPVHVADNKVVAKLIGPDQPFKRVEKRSRRRSQKGKQYEHPDMGEAFTVYLDPEKPIAKFVVQDTEFILEQGEWSDWVRVAFEVDCIPFTTVSSIARFYLKQVRPDFELYVTPLQINPEDPVLPISHPDDWSHELYEALGYFYTQELPEETKAFSAGIFTGREFRDQSEIVLRERMKALDHLLADFDEGFMFFYFSSVDQRSHMLWRYADPRHPYFERDDVLIDGIREIYRELDVAVGQALEAIDDDDTLIVMSDHGFGPFYWGVNLNTWLLENGYLALKNPAAQESVEYLFGVDWSKTKAYALGLNGLYVNLRGREGQGIVNPGAEQQELLDRLEADLLALRDPRNDQQAVTLVVQTERDFHGSEIAIGPDIIVGYNKGYRSSWESPLGEFPKEIFIDNPDPWSGDHLTDYRHVPGVLLTNQKITMEEPALYDLTVAILDEYGIDKTPEMLGQDCLERREDPKLARRTDP
jgi:predicted AlkP superfamily phosphohydrolase/phosphomutase